MMVLAHTPQNKKYTAQAGRCVKYDVKNPRFACGKLDAEGEPSPEALDTICTSVRMVKILLPVDKLKTEKAKEYYKAVRGSGKGKGNAVPFCKFRKEVICRQAPTAVADGGNIRLGAALMHGKPRGDGEHTVNSSRNITQICQVRKQVACHKVCKCKDTYQLRVDEKKGCDTKLCEGEWAHLACAWVAQMF